MERAAFAQIGDTHIWRDAAHLPRVERLFEHLQSQQDHLDFIVHVGDIAGQNCLDSCGVAEDYELFQAYLSGLSIPLYPVVGNHDDSRLITLPPSARPLLSESGRCCYQFSHGSLGAVVLDARVGTGPESVLPCEQLQELQRLLRAARTPLCVFTHFPPIPLGTHWLDELMIMVNGNDLHNLLVEYAGMVAGVFVGHVHAPFSALRDGVLYVGCGSPAWAFRLAPGPVPFEKADHGPTMWNLVTVGDEGVVVRPQVVPSSERSR